MQPQWVLYKYDSFFIFLPAVHKEVGFHWSWQEQCRIYSSATAQDAMGRVWIVHPQMLSESSQGKVQPYLSHCTSNCWPQLLSRWLCCSCCGRGKSNAHHFMNIGNCIYSINYYHYYFLLWTFLGAWGDKSGSGTEWLQHATNAACTHAIFGGAL